MKKKRISIPVLALCILLFAIAGTGAAQAYYNSSREINNMLVTKGSGVVLQEIFNGSDKWLPGETKTKEVWFANEADGPQVLRFKAEGLWTDSAGNAFYTGLVAKAPKLNWTTALAGADGDPATLDAGQEWTRINNYYYYNKVLQPANGSDITTTAPVLTSVTFGEDLSNDDGWGDYSDKTYTLTITMETVDVDSTITKELWNTGFGGTDDSLHWP